MCVCLVGYLPRSSKQSLSSQEWHFSWSLHCLSKGKKCEAYFVGVYFYIFLLRWGSVLVGKCSSMEFTLEGCLVWRCYIYYSWFISWYLALLKSSFFVHPLETLKSSFLREMQGCFFLLFIWLSIIEKNETKLTKSIQ